jgi:hypothetical protein
MSGEIVTIDQMQPMSVAQIKQQVQTIQQVMADVMIDGTHYGKIPGCGDKPALLKAGAEKLCMTFRLDPEYDITTERDGNHLTITSKCTLHYIPNGARMGSGMGSCSSRESKYAYRSAVRKCPSCGVEAIIKGKAEYGGGWLCYGRKGGCGKKFPDGDAAIEGQSMGRVANEDLADQYNTVLKMSNKRSLVAAVLNVLAASDIFAQDLADDLTDDDHGGGEDAGEKKPAVQQPRAKSSSTPEISTTGTKPAASTGKPLNESMLKVVRATAKNKGITEAELCAHFKAESLETLTVGVNDVLGWLANPGA